MNLKVRNPNGAASLARVTGVLASAFSVLTGLIVLFSPPTRNATENAMGMGIINLVVFGPVFGIGVVSALFARENRKPCLLLNSGYLLGWLLAIVFDVVR